MKRYRLLGVYVDSISPDELSTRIIKLSELNKPSYIVFLDTYLLMKAQFSNKLLNIINSADIILPISPGIARGLKFFQKNVEKVYNYFNFIITLLLNFTEKKKFIYILGGENNNVENAKKKIEDSFPGIKFICKFHGQYRNKLENNLITAIRKASPSLVLVGNESPKQEKWIYKRIKEFNMGIFIGVGNFINIIGGKEGAPSDKSIHSFSYAFKNFLKNPLRIGRGFYYFLYIFFLLLYKIFKNR